MENKILKNVLLIKKNEKLKGKEIFFFAETNLEVERLLTLVDEHIEREYREAWPFQMKQLDRDILLLQKLLGHLHTEPGGHPGPCRAEMHSSLQKFHKKLVNTLNYSSRKTF